MLPYELFIWAGPIAHFGCPLFKSWLKACIQVYYMEKSVLLGTKPLVDSIRHFIRDPSGVFSICHLCECHIIQWSHDSRLLLLLNWFLHIIKRTLHVGSKIWILCSCGKNNISLEHKFHIFSSLCNILYIWILFWLSRAKPKLTKTPAWGGSTRSRGFGGSVKAPKLKKWDITE